MEHKISIFPINIDISLPFLSKPVRTLCTISLMAHNVKMLGSQPNFNNFSQE